MNLCPLKAVLLDKASDLITLFRLLAGKHGLIYLTLGSLPIWLSRDDIVKFRPKSFKQLYPRSRVELDCTELKPKRHVHLITNNQLPLGAFNTSLYNGSIADVDIIQLRGQLDLLKAYNDVTADNGFILKEF
ncbi:hypothetical protein MAR_000591 [Mya arenaria]|uniref:Uncharacterized protein n=1 Tax=Mya arenaria TaxID=6604 RepID=A0ABY7F997_MYAAR|nr:hypothetical protein MAR_000591 [Mya arenaria]